LWYDLPYAVALRDFFSEYKMRAQQNTRYIEADIEEAIRTHTIDTLISMLTRADIQSTITPDEGRNVPWHYNNIRAIQTVKQTWAALDGIQELVSLNKEGPLGEMARDLKERAVAFLEEVLEVGGYFAAVEKGFFVDSGKYPDRNGDGIARDGKGGVGAGSIIPRDPDYYAPVCSHFGHNHLPAGVQKACDPIGGCTLDKPEKIVYIDELDTEDTCAKRLEKMEGDPAWQSRMADLRAIPSTEQQKELTRWLCARAVETSIRRHAGKVTDLYTPMGKRKIVKGKDLTAVRWGYRHRGRPDPH
jgi:D-ornithine 4,5-aminomutase subunit beta